MRAVRAEPKICGRAPEPGRLPASCGGARTCRGVRAAALRPDAWMDVSLAQAAPPLRRVGRYQLVSRVISGALGDLWRAKIASGPEEGRVVLVRLIPRTAAIDAHAVERLTNAGFAAMEL